MSERIPSSGGNESREDGRQATRVGLEVSLAEPTTVRGLILPNGQRLEVYSQSTEDMPDGSTIVVPLPGVPIAGVPGLPSEGVLAENRLYEPSTHPGSFEDYEQRSPNSLPDRAAYEAEVLWSQMKHQWILDVRDHSSGKNYGRAHPGLEFIYSNDNPFDGGPTGDSQATTPEVGR